MNSSDEHTQMTPFVMECPNNTVPNAGFSPGWYNRNICRSCNMAELCFTAMSVILNIAGITILTLLLIPSSTPGNDDHQTFVTCNDDPPSVCLSLSEEEILTPMSEDRVPFSIKEHWKWLCTNQSAYLRFFITLMLSEKRRDKNLTVDDKMIYFDEINLQRRIKVKRRSREKVMTKKVTVNEDSFTMSAICLRARETYVISALSVMSMGTRTRALNRTMWIKGIPEDSKNNRIQNMFSIETNSTISNQQMFMYEVVILEQNTCFILTFSNPDSVHIGYISVYKINS